MHTKLSRIVASVLHSMVKNRRFALECVVHANDQLRKHTHTHTQEDLKRGHVQQHRTELQRQIAAHAEAALAERVARAAEARSVQVTNLLKTLRGFLFERHRAVDQRRHWPLACQH